MKHTPNLYHLPWAIDGEYIVNVKGIKVFGWLDSIVLSRAGHQDVDGHAFAEFIVCAVNSHADLLEKMGGIKTLAQSSGDSLIEALANDAIAKATP